MRADRAWRLGSSFFALGLLLVLLAELPLTRSGLLFGAGGVAVYLVVEVAAFAEPRPARPVPTPLVPSHVSGIPPFWAGPEGRNLPPLAPLAPPTGVAERIAYFRRWAGKRSRSERRAMGLELKRLKDAATLERLERKWSDDAKEIAERNRAWVESERAEVERSLLSAMGSAMPRGPSESREDWENRRRTMLEAWRD